MDELQSGNKPVHVLNAGKFGAAVVRHLTLLRTDITETGVEDNLIPLPATWPAARMLALVSWRVSAELCELMNEVSYDRRIPFIPVVQDLTAIRVGPIIVPGSGPCWHCWVTRWRQHSGWTHERLSLSRYYSSHPEDGPRGYLEPFAAMAAVRLAEIVAAVDSEDAVPGYIWQIEVLTGEIKTGVVAGVHDCSWCGLGLPKATRSVAELQKQMSYLWSPEAQD